MSPVLRSGDAGMLPCGAGRERAGVFSPGACEDWSDDLHAEIAMNPRQTDRRQDAYQVARTTHRNLLLLFVGTQRDTRVLGPASSTAQRSTVDRKNTVTLLAQQFPALLVAHESGRPSARNVRLTGQQQAPESERPLRTLRPQSRPSIRFCRHAGFLARPRRRATTDSLPASADHPNLVVNQVD